MNHDRLIDPVQVELLREELRYYLVVAQEAQELIRLYDFQQMLIRQWEQELRAMNHPTFEILNFAHDDDFRDLWGA